MLTDRQMLILKMIVDDYVRSAEPVGSRTISKHPDLGFSAATIRNEMADLEELGFLEQPHTSAGRIPSQLGYRYYVDHLMTGAHLDQDEITMIRSVFSERMSEIERVAQQTVQILSGLTQYTAVVLGPQVYDTTLRSLQVVPLSERTAVVLVVTSAGQVHNKTVSIPEDVSVREVEHLVRRLNDRLVGTPMYRIRSRTLEEIMRDVARSVEDYENAIRILDQILPIEAGTTDNRVYVGGSTNMLLQPEFKDVQKAKSVLSWLEKPVEVFGLLKAEGVLHKRIQIRIGGENDVETLQECSLVTMTYYTGDSPVGIVGVIGPTRMEYGRVIQLLSHLTVGLSDVLTKFYGG